MNQIFEGHKQANDFAELNSKKMNMELFVIKCGSSGSYGINYQVRNTTQSLRQGEKVINVWDKGNLKK